MMTDLLRVDREHLMVKEGLVVVVAIMIGALVEALLGEVAIYAVAAAYFVSRVGVHERGRRRWRYMLVATVAGVALSALALLVGDDTLRAVLLWSGTIYLAGLALAYGRSAFYAGYFLVFWVLFAMLTASRSPGEPIDYAASFLLGGAVAMIFMAVRVHFGWIEEIGNGSCEHPDTDVEAGGTIGCRCICGLWALTMAIAIGIGYTFWSVEPFWVASTLLVVMQPDVAKGIKTGIQRGIGSAVGGILALALIAMFPGFAASDLFILYFFATTALCVMFYKANYHDLCLLHDPGSRRLLRLRGR